MGALFADIGPSQLTIGGSAEKGNRLNSLGVGISLMDFDGSTIDVSFNRMADMQLAGVFAGQGTYLPQTAASSLRIRNNTIEANTHEDSAGSGWHSGIQLWENFGGFNPPTATRLNPVEISSNAVEVNFLNTGSMFDHNGISLVNVSGATVQGNRISGTTENAIYVGGYLPAPASRNAVAGNNLEQFLPHAGRAHILLDTTSEYCTVNGSGNTTVTDKGTGNTVNGARRQ
jgi:hypothetical protein